MGSPLIIGWFCGAGSPCGEGSNRGLLWGRHWLAGGSLGLVVRKVRTVAVVYCRFVRSEV